MGTLSVIINLASFDDMQFRRTELTSRRKKLLCLF